MAESNALFCWSGSMPRSNPLLWPKPPTIWSYGIAVLSVAAALIISRLPAVHLQDAPVSLFLCAVLLSAWFGGIGPGLLATTLSALAFNYYFLPPIHSLGPKPDEIPRLVIFTVSALFVGSLSAAERSAIESFRRARDDLKKTVQELQNTNEALQAESDERQRAEEALRRSEGYLAEAQRLTHTGSWAWRVAGRDAVHLSEEWYRIYGFDPEDGMPNWERRLQCVHREDRAKWQEAIDRAIRERSDYEVEYRIILPSGTVKYIHAIGHPVLNAYIGHPVLNAYGDLVQFVGSSTDITERKQAEEKIRQSEMELRQILDFAPQCVAVLGPDRDRTRLYTNQTMLDYFGFTLEEWRSSDRRKYYHPDDWERLTSETQSKFLSGLPHEYEARFLRKDGKYRWFLFRWNPLRDEQGRVTRWYAAATDIEERKQAEQRLQNENVALREEIDKASMFEEIVGTSPLLQTVLTRVSKVAPTDSSVLITGETGTGKELVARAIHRRSQRSSRAFVSVNCASIPSTLIASELFGHEKGAFTGALQQRRGRFELAHSGSIFLDEVGELPHETQIALLRVLQERQFERVGGDRVISTDVRVIAATNRDLSAAIAAGVFRADLFYRLNVFPIHVPPLRQRKEDIPMLVEYFVKRYAEKAKKDISRIDKNTLKLCQSYHW